MLALIESPSARASALLNCVSLHAKFVQNIVFRVFRKRTAFNLVDQVRSRGLAICKGRRNRTRLAR